MVYCVREDISVDPLLCCCQMTTPIRIHHQTFMVTNAFFVECQVMQTRIQTHLLKNKADCEEASTVFYSPHDHSNRILLCGAEGYGISSRGQFDKFHMSFRHVTDSDLTSWIVIGGGSRHGRIVKWGSKSSWKDSEMGE